MPDTHFEHIERFLHNELSPEELQQFEKQLAEDGALREDLRIYKEINGMLSLHFNPSQEEINLKKQLQHRQAAYFSSGERMVKAMKSRRSMWYTIVSIAAAAAIILFIWSPWQQNILSQYGQIKMTSPIVRGNEQNQLLTRASELFNQKKFSEALPLLDSLAKRDPDNAQSRFYRGVTLLHLHQPQSARKDLQLIFHGQSVYRFDAAYFTALSYLQQNQSDSCRTWLQKIPESAAIYPKAKKLLSNTATQGKK